MESSENKAEKSTDLASAEASPLAIESEEIPAPSEHDKAIKEEEYELAGDERIDIMQQSTGIDIYQPAGGPSQATEDIRSDFNPDMSTRRRVPTEKGLEYQQQIRKRALKSAITKWRRKIDETEDVLADCEDVMILSRQRDELSIYLSEVETSAACLSELCLVEEPIERMEEETRQLRKGLNSKITDLREEARSTMSRRSKGSSKGSRSSSRSSKALKLDAVTKAAELRVQLRYHDEEAAFSKFKLRKELDVQNARLQAIAEREDIEESTYVKLPETEEEASTRVEHFIRTLPAQISLGEQHDHGSTIPTREENQMVGTTGETSATGMHTQALFMGLTTMPPTGTTVTPPVTTSVQISDTAGQAVRLQSNVLPRSAGQNPVSITDTAFYTRPPIFSTRVSASSFPQYNQGHGLNPRAPQFVPSSSVALPSTEPTRFSEPFYENIMHSMPTHTTGPRYSPQDVRSTQQSNTVLDLAEYMLASRVQPPEPPIFSGNPLEYPGWKSAFETLVENKRIPECDKIHYLKRYLSGEALQCIDGYFLFSTEASFMSAKRVLEERYGDPFIVEDAFRTKLAKWPKVSSMDCKALRHFGDFLRQCLGATHAIPSLDVLNDVRENQKLQEKLPDWVLRRWSRVVANHKFNYGCFPRFEIFVKFVVDEAEIACNPAIISRDRETTRDTKSKGQRKSSHALATATKNEKARQSPAKDSSSNPKPEKKRNPCYLCKETHNLENCPAFLQMTVEDRRKYVRNERLCYACLGIKHRAKNCRYKKKCKKCKREHPTCLHEERDMKRNTESTAQTSEEQSSAGNDSPAQPVSTEETVSAKQTHVSLYAGVTEGSQTSMIVPVYISHSDEPNHEVLTYAMLDSQSDTTFILEETCKKLKVDGTKTTLKLSTMTAENQLIHTKKLNGLTVRGLRSNEVVELPPTYSRPSVPVNKEHIPTADTANKWPHLRRIVNEIAPLQDAEIGLLIGYDCPVALSPQDFIAAPTSGGPYAQKSVLGWGIIGFTTHNDDESATCHRIMTEKCQLTGSAIVVPQLRAKEIVNPGEHSSIWDNDSSDLNCDKTSYLDAKFLEKMNKETTVNDSGNYEMPLPFNGDDPCLPNNRFTAEKRLMGLRNKMAKNQEYHREYVGFMEDIIAKGYAELCSEDPVPYHVWYIPHHGVYHPKKKKIRVVFDCAAEYKGVNLNGLLLQGPDLTNKLLGVLCRFRKENIAIICDIQKMFFQFYVPEQHRDYLRFLWWPRGDTSKPPCEYRMTVHLFGAVSSPACANYGLKRTADEGETEFGSEAADFIRNSFYVDDGLTSVATDEEAIRLVAQTRDLCATRGIRLHKFASNSKQVLESIAVEDRAESLQNMHLPTSSNVIERALGIEWNIQLDKFQFKIVIKDRPLTRRGILSAVGSIFDPLGFFAPVVLLGRTILQEICRLKADWDDPLPDNIIQRWLKWRHDLQQLETIRVDRCYKPKQYADLARMEIHHFSDASSSGYGQVSYMRMVDKLGRVHCSFLLGKARVAPLKVITIPRLELCAAVLSVKQSRFLVRELELHNVEEIFWCDSQVVLGYVNNDARRFHVFVANRVQQIRSHTEPEQWRYVSSNDNPADDASRGLFPTDFVKKSSWLTGPEFLWKRDLPPVDQSEHFPEISPDNPEVKRVRSLAATTRVIDHGRLVDSWDRFSSWSRLRRVVARCLIYKKRLLDIIRAKRDQKDAPPATALNVDVLIKAEQEIVKSAQRCVYAEEIASLEETDNTKPPLKRKSSLFKLHPFVDNNGILRVGGRLEKGSFHIGLKHPVILPKGHISVLVARYYHFQHHQGRGMTISSIREAGYWIIGCKAVVSKVIHDCVICRKYRGSLQTQKMAPLPEDRLEETPPFTYCAVDYFGPFYIRIKRSDVPRYGAIFTCLMSRAVHLEVADSLETDAFINALRRFIAIRGPIRQLRCDRGTNFIGAKNEFERVREFLLKNSCDSFEFRLNVPSASHMGGVWERQIRTVRNVLRPLLEKHGSQLDDESLRTLFYEVMAIVNSRPLAVSDLYDPLSAEILTPNHILTMKTKVVLPPPGAFPETDVYNKRRWRRVQHLLNVFWSRWRTEYLSQLQTRQKWNQPRRNMIPGDIIILKEDNAPRNKWPLAIVQDIFPSDDGLVRKIKVRMADTYLDKNGVRTKSQSVLERPVHKCILLIPGDSSAEEPLGSATQ